MGWEATKALVTWALVVFGWVFIADQQEMREAKKEGLSRLVALRKAAVDARNRAIRFHTSPFSAEEQIAVQAALSDLGYTCSLLERASVISSTWTKTIRQLRQAAQDDNFDLSVHEPLTQASEVVAKIVVSHLDLDRYLAQCELQTLMRPVTIWASMARISRVNRLVAWRAARKARGTVVP